MFALNKTDGSGVWGIDLCGRTFASPAVADGYLAIGTLSRQVIIFREAAAITTAVATPQPGLPSYVIPSETSSGGQATATASPAPFPGALAAIGAVALGFVLRGRR